ncbi:MAG: TetR/AcrR family transcriptional regulator [Bacteroidota bacterium]
MAASYHHGDLRRALLDHAGSVLEEKGIGSLSLRDLARRAGVSATAPYHHFKGKADLVAALGTDAMEQLDAALAGPDHADPNARLRAMGVEYVMFAVSHPERFRLAFRPEMGDPFTGVGADGAMRGDDVLGFRQLAAVVREIEPNEEQQVALAIAAWGMVHGLASLFVDGPLRPLAEDLGRVRQMAEAAIARMGLSTS